jgi:hypothetical protein
MFKCLVNLFKDKRIDLEIGETVIGKQHYWDLSNFNKKTFYKLPGYKGTFKLTNSQEMSYLGYTEHTFIRENTSNNSIVKKIYLITEEQVKINTAIQRVTVGV